jgi:hypothetical protein
MLGFWAMWLKVHHPLEFYAAQLHKTSDDDKRVLLMRDMQDKRFGRSYKVLPPAPGESGWTWTPVKGGVRAGFLQVPGVGEAKAQMMKEFDDEVGIDDWHDLIKLKGFGVKTVEKIQAFADSRDPFGINKIVEESEGIRKAIRNNELPGCAYPGTLSDEIPYEAKKTHQVIMGLLKSRNLQDLFENHRSRTGEELDPATVKNPELKDSMTLYLEDEAGLMTVKVGRDLYPSLKERLWDARVGKDYIVCSTVKYAFLGKTVHVNKMWVVNPE